MGSQWRGSRVVQAFVKQSAFVAIGPNQALMDPCGERHGEEALSRVHKQADGLQGMAHDVFRLSVGFRLLMQQLDGSHLLAALGKLDAVSDQDQPAVDTHRTWEQPNTACAHKAASRSSL